MKEKRFADEKDLLGSVLMSHVFVSYSRKDSETVTNIVARLEGDGLSVWFDCEDIRGGELWRETIVKAIDTAYAFVLMLSPNSVASENVRKEVDLAEGANRHLLPVMLASVELPAKLRYQLAGIQWIEYYRDPDVKYAELVEVLRAQEPKQLVSELQAMREVEMVIQGVNLSKFGPEEQEKLLRFFAELTNTPRVEIILSRITAGSVHAFVNMPPDSAYQLKTAALNRDVHLINYGIDALRLSGDRYFVFVKTGHLRPLKAGTSGVHWFIGSLALLLALFMSALIITAGLPLASTYISSFVTPATPSSRFTFTPSPSDTSTPTLALTPTLTSTPSPSLTATRTPTNTPSATSTFSPTVTPSSFGIPQLSTNQIYYGGATCEPRRLTIRVIAQHPAGIKVVIFFHKLREIDSGKQSDWSAGWSMNTMGDDIYTLSVSGDTFIGDTAFTGQTLVSYQFAIQANNGEIVRSNGYSDLYLLPCRSSRPPPPAISITPTTPSSPTPYTPVVH